jgi:hypothetical protein
MSDEPVITALVEQVECYRRLARLAELQHLHVQKGQTEDLLGVLRQRQEVLDRAAVQEAVIAPAKRRWQEFLGKLDGESRTTAESLMSETRRLLEQITTADRNDALVLQQRKLNLGRKITRASAARQVNRNYSAAAYGTRRPSMDIQR